METLVVVIAFAIGVLLGGGLVFLVGGRRRVELGPTPDFPLKVANQIGDQVVRVATEKLHAERSAMEGSLRPFRELLDRLQQRTDDLETKRTGAYAALEAELKRLIGATGALGEQTASLSTALRGTRSGGRWGELALRNVVDFAGMTEHCDFDEQTATADGKRPDLTVHLPGGRLVAIDAKVPIGDYLDAFEAEDTAARKAALDRHVKAVQAHVKELSKRDYASLLGAGVDLVVLFLPSDALLSAAFSRAPRLQEESLRAKVLIATPTTLVALLRTVALYWQRETVAKNSELIMEVSRELYERVATFTEHLSKVGSGLKTSVEAYNKAVGSFDRRVVPTGRRLEELKVAEGAKRKLEAPSLVENAPRDLRGA